MILTISLNSILERKYYLEKLQPKLDNLAEKSIYTLGGEGVLATTILNNFNIDIFIIGFLGGLNGQYIFKELKERNIHSDFISIKEESKSAVAIFEEEKILTKIYGPDPRITREELGSFYELFKRIMGNHEFIFALGDLPMGVPKDIYFDLISLAKHHHKKFFLDARGMELALAIDSGPFMVKVNKEELENLTKLKLNFENEIIKAGKFILDKGVEILVIDLEHRGSIVLKQEKGFRLEIDRLNLKSLKEDKGYTLAGYAMALDRKYDFEVMIKLGQALRVVGGLVENVDLIDMSDIKRIMGSIDIRPIIY